MDSDPPQSAPANPVAHTRHGSLTFEQIAAIQPGLARLMTEISDRYWILYYAAQGGNWRLAHYQYRQLVNTFQIAVVTRPKHARIIESYVGEWLRPIEEAIHAKDLMALEKAHLAAADQANAIHRQLNHAEIVWKLPSEPPKHLQLGPVHPADKPAEE